MIEISVVDEKPQLVAGMRRSGHYKEIAKMLPALFEYAMSHGAIIAGPPLYLWHEKSVEEAMKADEAGNADIEVCVPIAEKIPENDEIKCYELSGGKMAQIIHNLNSVALTPPKIYPSVNELFLKPIFQNKPLN